MNKRYVAWCEEWCIGEDENGKEIWKNMWGVKDNTTNEWALLPELIDGKYNIARTRAKEMNQL
ncbi:hypothetical protein [Fictibacillus sp. NRS-1165]|uniref:hypothetical protein n=1 Tax=Fictibacillus sp. NRS-1165 TaxID=3144463 RepID=UPI003D24F66A